MTVHVVVYQLGVFSGVVEHMGAWADNAHVALDYIDEIGDFVDMCAAHETAKGEYAWIIGCGLKCVALVVQTHGAKLVAYKCLAVKPGALLLEHYGAAALHLDD